MRTIESRVDIPKTSPDELVQGYGKALADILGKLTLELQNASAK